ncbi:MAG: response regulator, partial [Ignavibacterium sp.]
FISQLLISKSQISNELLVINTVEKALDFFLNNNNSIDKIPDLILLDINLPALTGHDFLKEFEEFPESIKNKTKIAVLSSSDKEEDVQKMKKNTFVLDYFIKPLDKNALEKITNLLIT